jgi:hypothetical protein
LNVLEEINAAFQTCEREYALYPEPNIKKLVVALYHESLLGITTIFKTLTVGPVKRISTQFLAGNDLQHTIKKVKGFSAKVIKEMEYLHRRELREAHVRLREVDRKQDEVIRAWEDQRRILVSLQEEQKILAAVTDHQKVLQMIQQLLARFPPSTETTSAVSDSTKNEEEGAQV